jgi:type II secretory pathway component GspD/PulD (secretin)
VDRSDRIVLEIHPEVSTGTISDGLPSQTTTEVTTKLVAEDGQRIFIGGLIKDKETRNRLGVPYLMDIPVLGWLFRREETKHANSETVVILTAHLSDDSTPVVSAGKAEMTRQTGEYLEKHRQRMERYFGPDAPNARPEAEASPSEGGSGEAEESGASPPDDDRAPRDHADPDAPPAGPPEGAPESTP